MFDALSDRFDGIFKRLRSRGRLSEDDVEEVLREIRLALLEADVNFHVVRSFRDRVKERCVGAELHKALNPAQQVIKIVHEELIETYRDTFSTPYVAAGHQLVDDIVEPSRTRMVLARALESLHTKRDLRPAKKHGLIPL